MRARPQSSSPSPGDTLRELISRELRQGRAPLCIQPARLCEGPATAWKAARPFCLQKNSSEPGAGWPSGSLHSLVDSYTAQTAESSRREAAVTSKEFCRIQGLKSTERKAKEQAQQTISRLEGRALPSCLGQHCGRQAAQQLSLSGAAEIVQLAGRCCARLCHFAANKWPGALRAGRSEHPELKLAGYQVRLAFRHALLSTQASWEHYAGRPADLCVRAA